MTDRRPILGLILAVTATGIMANTLLSPAIPNILDDFGVGDSGAGVLIAAGSLPGVIVAPVVGVLADRLGRRRVLVPCLAVFGVFGVAAILAPTFPALVVARLGMGLGAAGLINLAVVLIGDHWEGDERTRLIGRNAAFLTVCIAVFPLIGGVLTELFGWRAALAPYVFALVTAAVALAALEPGDGDRSQSVREQLAGGGDVARRPEVVLILIGGMVAFVLIFGVVLSTLPLHLEEQFGYDAGIRGVFLALPAVSSTIVAFNIVRLRRFVDGRMLFVVCALLFAAGLMLVGIAATAVLLVVGALVYGAGEGVLIPAIQDRITDLAPADHRAAIISISVGASRLGQTIGPLAAALLLTSASTTAALFAGAAVALGLAALFRFGPYEGRAESAVAGTRRES